MKKIFILLFGIISIPEIHAQNEIDALRYSQNSFFGTAKFTSMAGSFGSLGGDFSTLSLNPAGIAFYQNSELTYTPNFSFIDNTSYLNGNKNTKNSPKHTALIHMKPWRIHLNDGHSPETLKIHIHAI